MFLLHVWSTKEELNRQEDLGFGILPLGDELEPHSAAGALVMSNSPIESRLILQNSKHVPTGGVYPVETHDVVSMQILKSDLPIFFFLCDYPHYMWKM